MSRTASAKSVKNCSGYDLDADFFAVGQLPEPSTALNSFFRFDSLLLLTGVLLSWLMIAGVLLFVATSFDGYYTSSSFVVLKLPSSIIISSNGAPIV